MRALLRSLRGAPGHGVYQRPLRLPRMCAGDGPEFSGSGPQQRHDVAAAPGAWRADPMCAAQHGVRPAVLGALHRPRLGQHVAGGRLRGLPRQPGRGGGDSHLDRAPRALRARGGPRRGGDADAAGDQGERRAGYRRGHAAAVPRRQAVSTVRRRAGDQLGVPRSRVRGEEREHVRVRLLQRELARLAPHGLGRMGIAGRC
mmetsp:Transcript_127597/g.357274  ORF Transcript_127597/g.357274 Transcript_127597/m.357274 type:complete len:201 (-) Transcript_127597:330-932(-)